MKLSAIFISLLFLISSNRAVAETSLHKHVMTPEMKKQHQAMEIINKQWNACKKTLNNNNLNASDRAIGKMLEAATYMEKFKLHRNADKHEQFVEQCKNFKENLINLREAIKTGDTNATNRFSIKVQDNCYYCHKIFR